MAKHVAVLMGGWSSERPVSLSSGNACADALEATGFRVTRVDVARNVAEVLTRLQPDAPGSIRSALSKYSARCSKGRCGATHAVAGSTSICAGHSQAWRASKYATSANP